jgi:hypothetical protein
VHFRYKRDIKLAGILYFHRITDKRPVGIPLKNLRMFEKLCGKNALSNIILTTTMWDRVDETTGQEREKELKGQYWESMIRLGSTTVRYHNTKDSAWEILDKVLQSRLNQHAVLLEDVEGLLKETDVGGPVYTALKSLVRRQQDALDEIRDETREQTDREVLERMRNECGDLHGQLETTIADMRIVRRSVKERFFRYFTSPYRLRYWL